METPIAVLVTNATSTWRKGLCCLGMDESEARLLLYRALLHFQEGHIPAPGDGNIQARMEHAALPSEGATATRTRLPDGYLYLLSREQNTFFLEGVCSELANVRPTPKSAGLTLEDVAKDFEGVVAMVEAALMPHLLHRTRKLVCPLPAKITPSPGGGEPFDLSQKFRPCAPLREGETQPLPAETPAPAVPEPEAQGEVDLGSGGLAADAGTDEGTEIDGGDAGRQEENEVPAEVEEPTPAPQPVVDSLDLFGLPVAAAEDSSVGFGGEGDPFAASPAADPAPPPPVVSNIAPPLSPAGTSGMLNAPQVDSPMTMINAMFQDSGGARKAGGTGAALEIRETVSLRLRAACSSAKCEGSVGVACGAQANGSASLKLDPKWVGSLASLRVAPGAAMSADGLVVDCGAASEFRETREVLRYGARPDRYPIPARALFECSVGPRQVALQLQVLKSPRTPKAVNSIRCAVSVPIGRLPGWKVASCHPKAFLDVKSGVLEWRADALAMPEPAKFRAVLTKPEDQGPTTQADLVSISGMEAQILAISTHQPFVHQDCQVRKRVDLQITALPVVSLRT